MHHKIFQREFNKHFNDTQVDKFWTRISALEDILGFQKLNLSHFQVLKGLNKIKINENYSELPYLVLQWLFQLFQQKLNFLKNFPEYLTLSGCVSAGRTTISIYLWTKTSQTRGMNPVWVNCTFTSTFLIFKIYHINLLTVNIPDSIPEHSNSPVTFLVST